MNTNIENKIENQPSATQANITRLPRDHSQSPDITEAQPAKTGGKQEDYESEINTIIRDKDGRFAKGYSGNLSGKFIRGRSGNRNGRPKISLAASRKIATKLIDSRIQDITEEAIHQAACGNIQAIKFVLGHVLPKKKDDPINIQLPPINNADDIKIAYGEIITALNNGEITLDEARKLQSFLKDCKEVICGNEPGIIDGKLVNECTSPQPPAQEEERDDRKDARLKFLLHMLSKLEKD